MIAGFVITAGIAGALLDPFTHARLVAVTAGVSAAAFALTLWRSGAWNAHANAQARPPSRPSRSRRSCRR